jgi:hypothetical protein
MQQGEWYLGCDAIGFDETGTLINGQHRLYAVIQSEQAFPLLSSVVSQENQEML